MLSAANNIDNWILTAIRAVPIAKISAKAYLREA